MSSISGLGPPAALVPFEPAPAAGSAPAPDGTSDSVAALFPGALTGGPAADTPDGAFALLTLKELEAAIFGAGNLANRIKAAVALLITKIGALASDVTRSNALRAQADGLRQQLGQLQTDLDAAEAKLAQDQESHPDDQDLLARDQAAIDGINHSIADVQGQLAANANAEAQIAGRLATLLSDFATVANAIIGQLSEQSRDAAIAAQQTLAADEGLRAFLDDVQRILREVQQAANDGAAPPTRVAQAPDSVPASSAASDDRSRTGRDQPPVLTTARQDRSATDVPPQDPTRAQPARARDAGDRQADDDRAAQREIAADAAQTDQQAIVASLLARPEDSVEPGPDRQTPRSPADPVVAANDEVARAKRSERVAPAEDARQPTPAARPDAGAAPEGRVAPDRVIAEAAKAAVARASEAVAALDRLLSQPAVAAPVARSADAVAAASLQDAGRPARLKIFS